MRTGKKLLWKDSGETYKEIMKSTGRIEKVSYHPIKRKREETLECIVDKLECLNIQIDKPTTNSTEEYVDFARQYRPMSHSEYLFSISSFFSITHNLTVNSIYAIRNDKTPIDTIMIDKCFKLTKEVRKQVIHHSDEKWKSNEFYSDLYIFCQFIDAMIGQKAANSIKIKDHSLLLPNSLIFLIKDTINLCDWIFFTLLPNIENNTVPYGTYVLLTTRIKQLCYLIETAGNDLLYRIIL